MYAIINAYFVKYFWFLFNVIFQIGLLLAKYSSPNPAKTIMVQHKRVKTCTIVINGMLFIRDFFRSKKKMAALQAERCALNATIRDNLLRSQMLPLDMSPKTLGR